MHRAKLVCGRSSGEAGLEPLTWGMKAEKVEVFKRNPVSFGICGGENSHAEAMWHGRAHGEISPPGLIPQPPALSPPGSSLGGSSKTAACHQSSSAN